MAGGSWCDVPIPKWYTPTTTVPRWYTIIRSKPTQRDIFLPIFLKSIYKPLLECLDALSMCKDVVLLVPPDEWVRRPEWPQGSNENRLLYMLVPYLAEQLGNQAEWWGGVRESLWPVLLERIYCQTLWILLPAQVTVQKQTSLSPAPPASGTDLERPLLTVSIPKNISLSTFTLRFVDIHSTIRVIAQCRRFDHILLAILDRS